MSYPFYFQKVFRDKDAVGLPLAICSLQRFATTFLHSDAGSHAPTAASVTSPNLRQIYFSTDTFFSDSGIYPAFRRFVFQACPGWCWRCRPVDTLVRLGAKHFLFCPYRTRVIMASFPSTDISFLTGRGSPTQPCLAGRL